MNVLGHFNYWIFIFLMMVGFYMLISRTNLIKKVIGLNVFQTAVFIFYISTGKIVGGTAPILFGEVAHSADEHAEEAGHAAEVTAETATQAAEAATHAAEVTGEVLYSNPLPHVLILTAIVVGIATTAVALALVVRIHEAYGTVEEDEIHQMDRAAPS